MTNSMAGLYIGDDGRGFIESVNAIHDTPYLQVVEVLLLGVADISSHGLGYQISTDVFD